MGQVKGPFIQNDVLYGANELVAQWIAKRIPDGYTILPTTKALGVWSGSPEDGRLVAGVAYNGLSAQTVICDFAGVPGVPWAREHVLAQLFHYPFVVCGYRRITTLVHEKNAPSLRATHRLGFTPEGTMSRAAHDGADLIVWRMFREDCPWIAEEDDDGHREIGAGSP